MFRARIKVTASGGDLDHEHYGITRLDARVELAKRIEHRALDYG